MFLNYRFPHKILNDDVKTSGVNRKIPFKEAGNS